MFKNYVFDLYGTLVDISTDEENWELWENIARMYCYKQANYSCEELKADYIKYVQEEKNLVRKVHPEYSHIDIKLEKVFKKLFTAKNVEVEDSYIQTIATAFRCFSTIWLELFENVTEVLETLKAKGKKVYLLSNAQRIFTENELNMFDLTKYFDGILISSDYECSKPDTNYYNILIEKYGLEKSETIMIGNDAVSDIKGAKDAGISCLFIPDALGEKYKKQNEEGKKLADYSIMDGDFRKILNLTVN